MKKHIIVEGMDGSGKDTLIQYLLTQDWGMPVFQHSRASTSIGGPVDELGGWVDGDLDVLESRDHQFRWIYNRHPLISEPIYGAVRPGKPTAWPFSHHPWWVSQARRIAAQSILVLVHPPFGVVNAVLEHQGLAAHMPGVFENRQELYARYATLMWPGEMIRWDRTRTSMEDLVKTLRLKLEIH